MSRNALLRLPAAMVVCVGIGLGCGEQPQNAGTELQLHDASKFTSEQLNAPLSNQAKASGAQVAAPPIR